MGYPSFTLRQLEYFEAVASEGSLTAASERCRVTPSALTLAIDDLERHLNLQLLIRRKGRGVTLTPAGSRILTHARSVLSRTEALSDDALRAARSVSGRFTVGCFTTLTPFFLPPIVEKFRRDYPDVQIELKAASAGELHEQLGQGRVDAALLYSVDVPHALTFEPVLEYRPHVIVPYDHPLANRGAVSLGELISEPLIVLDVPPTRQNTRGIFEQLSLSPTIGHVTSSFEAVRCLVGYGIGYAVMFQRPATPLTYDGHEVRVLEIIDPVPTTVVGLARPLGAPRSARYNALHTFLSRARMGGHPVSGADAVVV
ncbi:LysR family transcriptional regulator [Microbacterium sp. LRZ72]|uniref:LysR family transcriptional regulator n=1 Tax=Microbacterium sp. LRZ72 TaxID=2942481 RepID=UPI0029B30149|nr:LysR family transcriptional regulator [Microbacterium sp. LRZ72]MDX2376360.1 LysR family transcriptional regulator [Microbacterium sp. LRZ72]